MRTQTKAITTLPLIGKGSAGAPPTRETHRLLHVLTRERSRIDRCGGVLSLLVFHAPGRRLGRARRLRRLITVLKQRLRITDEVGLIDASRAFALLPDTDALGAEVLARMVQQRLAQEGLHFGYAVFRYVSGKRRDHDQRDDQDRRLPPTGGPTDHGTHAPDQPAHADHHAARMHGHRRHAGVLAHIGHEAHTCLVGNFPARLPAWKRSLDLLIASAALVAATPVMLAIAALIKLDSPGPVFFRQLRAGAGRRPFRIYKFRTMVDGAERRRGELLDRNQQDGPAFKLRDDPRVTRIGKVLRATSLDELPQLLNVLRGQMTLVGPRPLPVHEAEGCESWQDARHSVHPGLTCIWQVQGRSRVSFTEWARMDLSYIRRRSLWSDLRILAATVPAVLKRDGAV